MSGHQLKVAEFAFPGPLRDRLTAAVLSGAKTATSSLRIEYELDGEALPVLGERQVVVDSSERPIAIVEVIRVELVALGRVGLDVAHAEGEGFETVADWRVAHEAFWNGYRHELRDRLGDPGWGLDDDTAIVVEWFRRV